MNEKPQSIQGPRYLHRHCIYHLQFHLSQTYTSMSRSSAETAEFDNVTDTKTWTWTYTFVTDGTEDGIYNVYVSIADLELIEAFHS
jgi:hypothetical protein